MEDATISIVATALSMQISYLYEAARREDEG